MKRSRRKTIFWLFGVNLFISAFTFGGGYVVVPMFKKYFVQKKNFFSEDELVEMAAVAQSSPGAIAVNLSALAGYRIAGIAGAAVSCLAAVIPPLLILSVISVGYAQFAANSVAAAVLKGMQAGVAALIVDVIADMFAVIRKEKSWLLTLLVPLSFAACFICNINVAVILAVCSAVCIVRVFLIKRRKKYAVR